jgi:hypothetical protein
MENIPESVLIMIEQQPFDQLSDSDKQLVLTFVTENEYTAFHQTTALLRRGKEPFPEVAPSGKDKLLMHFVKHNSKTTPLWSTPIQFWKAASIFILLGAGWLIHWQTYQQQTVEYITQLDTVYLEKEVPVKVYDTVYYKEESAVSYASNPQRQNISSGKRMQQDAPVKNQPAREQRGLSAKDDSLIQAFKFVTL